MKLNKHILFQLPTFTARPHPPLLESEAGNKVIFKFFLSNKTSVFAANAVYKTS